MKTCSVENCNAPVWGKGFCKYHIPKKRLITNRNPSKSEKTEEMRDFFLSIWKKRPHYSEISGTRLPSPPSSAYFHHILSKGTFKEAALDEENIILLTIDEHANCHSDMYRYEEVNRRRELLKIKYKI